MKLTTTLMALAAMTAVSNASSISVSFGGNQNGGGDSLIEGGDAAGVNGATDWINGLGADGNTTANGITVTWDTEESWSQPSTNNSGDTELMSGWLSVNDNPSSTGTIDITGLTGTYDLYLYSGTDRVNQLNTFTETGGAFAATTITEDVSTGTLVDPFVYTDGTNGAGNYIKISGLSAATLNIVMDNGGDNRASLAGIQIVAVPEPSSTALLGLGGLALILRRRK